MNTAPNHFYYQINGSVIGPVTGIELRNAALAGNVVPATLVANDPNGEWVLAKFAQGLFDEGGTPLPHPPGTNQLLEGSQVDARVEQRPTTDSTAATGVGGQPKQFYFKHEGNVVGPMTGAELRESAHVGNVIPTTAVANDPNGEWVVANCIRGLFDERGRPLPHPNEGQRIPADHRLANDQPVAMVSSGSQHAASPEVVTTDATASSEGCEKPIWFYQYQGRVIGPLTGIQLQDAVLAGHVVPTTLVATNPSVQWFPAKTVGGLFAAGAMPLPHSTAMEATVDAPPGAYGVTMQPHAVTLPRAARPRPRSRRPRRNTRSRLWTTLGIVAMSAAVVILFFWGQANRSRTSLRDPVAESSETPQSHSSRPVSTNENAPAVMATTAVPSTSADLTPTTSQANSKVPRTDSPHVEKETTKKKDWSWPSVIDAHDIALSFHSDGSTTLLQAKIQLLRDVAVSAAKSNFIQGALRLRDELEKLDPKTAIDVTFDIAKAQAGNGFPDEAISTMSFSANNDPRRAEALVEIAVAHHYKGAAELAERDFVRARAIADALVKPEPSGLTIGKEDYQAIRRQMVVSYILIAKAECGDVETAIIEAISLKERTTRGWTNAVLSDMMIRLIQLDRYEEALLPAEHVVGGYLSTAVAARAAASWLADNGQVTKAHHVVATTIANPAWRIEVWGDIAEATPFRTHRTLSPDALVKEAIQETRAAEEEMRPACLEALARLYARTGDFERARKTGRLISKNKKTPPSVLVEIGLAELKRRRFEDANSTFSEVVETASQEMPVDAHKYLRRIGYQGNTRYMWHEELPKWVASLEGINKVYATLGFEDAFYDSRRRSRSIQR